MRILVPALKVYSIAFGLAVGGIYFQNRLRLELFFPPKQDTLTHDLLLGAGAATFIICVSLYASRNFLWAQLLDDEFSKILVPLQIWEMVLIALLSGSVEEVFFRGAIQPAIGLVPTSFLFGLAHFVPRKAFLPWSAYAVFAGFVLGSLFELTHHLLPVILAHSLINFVLIFLLNRRKTAQPA